MNLCTEQQNKFYTIDKWLTLLMSPGTREIVVPAIKQTRQ